MAKRIFCSGKIRNSCLFSFLFLGRVSITKTEDGYDIETPTTLVRIFFVFQLLLLLMLYANAKANAY